jgi:protein phosphatase 2C
MVSESEASTPCEQSSRAARRRRMEIRRFKFVSGGVSSPEKENEHKRQKIEVYSRDCENAVENTDSDEEKKVLVAESGRSESKDISISNQSLNLSISTGSLSPSTPVVPEASWEYPKYGVASVCGRRRDMEDAVAIHPSFCHRDRETTTELHYFGVYDGHGCSHVRVSFFDSINPKIFKKKTI